MLDLAKNAFRRQTLHLIFPVHRDEEGKVLYYRSLLVFEMVWLHLK